MHIAIKDQDLTHRAFGDQAHCGVSEVVKDTEASAVAGVRMMSSAGCVTGNAMRKRQPRRLQCAFHGQEGAIAKLRAPVETKCPELFSIETALRDCGNVRRIMDERQIVR